VGTITSASLELHAGDVEDAWQVASVEVTHGVTAQSVRFAFVGWVDSEDTDRQQQLMGAAAASAAAAQQQQSRGASPSPSSKHSKSPARPGAGGAGFGTAPGQLQPPPALRSGNGGAGGVSAAAAAAGGGAPQPPPPPRAMHCDYEVAVTTTDIPGAATECEVYLSLTGEEGATTGEVRLERSCTVGTIDARGRRCACFFWGGEALVGWLGLVGVEGVSACAATLY